MKYRAVIFDRDGVLSYFDGKRIDQELAPLLPISVQSLVLRWELWGQRYGFPANPEEEQETVQGFWRDLGIEYNLSSTIVSSLLDIDYTSFLKPFPDARPAMEYANSQGLRVGVLSNFTLASLEKSLSAIGLADLVDVACAATMIGVSKPAPEAYQIICDRLNVSVSECLFFDDEWTCIQGALAVGMDAYLVCRQNVAPQANIDAEVVANLSTLPDLVVTQ